MSRWQTLMDVVLNFYNAVHSEVDAINWCLLSKSTSKLFDRQPFIHLSRFSLSNQIHSDSFMNLIFKLLILCVSDYVWLLRRNQPLPHTTAVESIRLHNLQRILIGKKFSFFFCSFAYDFKNLSHILCVFKCNFLKAYKYYFKIKNSHWCRYTCLSMQFLFICAKPKNSKFNPNGKHLKLCSQAAITTK